MSGTALTYRAGGHGHVVDLDRLVASRMLIQANSGGGKSRAIRQLLEETHGRVQHLVIDPEGEFSTLREKFDYILAAKTGGDTIAAPKYAKRLCRYLVELNASAVLDLYDLSLDERREFVRHFLTELMSLPRTLWHPVIVVIDEMHVFAPEAGQSQAAEAVTALATQGRKRGFCLVGATQRISKLHKDVAAELLNKMIGRTGLDIDVKRAGDELGMGKDERNGLKTLAPGEFYVYGPAIANSVQLVRTGAVTTSHPEAGKVGSVPPPPSAKVRAMLSKLADLPKEAEQEAKTLADYEKQVKQLKGELSRAQRSGSEKVVEKVVVDERAVKRAVDAAVKPFQQKEAQVQRLLLKSTSALRALADSFEPLAGAVGTTVAVDVPTVAPASPARTTSSRPAPAKPVAASEVGNLTGARLKIVRALAELHAIGVVEVKRAQLSFYTGITFSGGYGSNTLGAMRTEGLVKYPTDGYVALTEDGLAAVGAFDPPSSLEELHERVRKHLTGLSERIFDEVVALGPGGSISRDDLGEKMGVTFSGGYGSNTLGALRTAGIIDYPDKGSVAPSDLLFPEGL